ncbi:MAG: hypothetical protein FJ387_18570, partial [Verrucomicrobia bacterium]|nr:hypothetical protein [Verrucomicrobiota bacterium]
MTASLGLLLVLGDPATARAQVSFSVDMEFDTPGIQASRVALPNEIIRVGLVLEVGATGVSAWGVSVNFDPSELDLNVAPAVTELLPAGLEFNFTDGVTVEASPPGHVRTSEAGALGSGPAGTSLLIGTMTFTVAKTVDDGLPDVEVGFFNAGVDGCLDNTSTPVAATFNAGFLVPRPSPPPANVAFANATLLPEPEGETKGTNRGATVEPGEPTDDSPAGTVWYRWQPAATGYVAFELADASYYARLWVFEGTALGSLTLVAAGVDGAPPVSQATTFLAFAERTYSIRVGGLSALGWTVISNTPAYQVQVRPGDVRFSRAAGGDRTFQFVGLQPPFEVEGDFDVQVDFREAQVKRVNGSPGNQINLIAQFGSQVFAVTRSDETANPADNVHIWADPPKRWFGAQGASALEGTLRIVRSGPWVAGFWNGTLLHSACYNTNRTALSFTLQNNGTSDATAVTFDNFR